MNSALLHYCSIAIILVLPVFGLALGFYQAIVGQWIAKKEQPAVSSNILTFFWSGALFIEGSSMFAAVAALILAGARPCGDITLPMAIGEIAFALSMGLCICATSIASGGICGAGCKAIARQPFTHTKVVAIVMFFIAFVEMSLIFGGLVAAMIYTRLCQSLSLVEAFGMLGASLCIGLGCMGPTLGLKKFACKSLDAIAQNRLITPILNRFSAIIIFFIDMVLIFSFICAVLMIFRPLIFSPMISLLVLISLSCSVALVGFGVTSAIADIGSKVMTTLAKDQSNYSNMRMFIGLSACLIETSLLFCMLMIISIIFYFS